MLIDTHSHLFWDSYLEDFNEVIDRALQVSVTATINIGVDFETSQKAAKLQSDKLKFYSSIGIHPHEAVKYFSNPDVSIHKDIERIEKIYSENTSKVVGVGECGLDYLFSANDLHPNITLSSEEIKNLQTKLFQAQIDLAKKLDLPLLVHCRDDRTRNPQNSEAWSDVLEMIGTHKTVLHCYSGLEKTTYKALSRSNLFFSFAGNITYPKNEYLREAIKIIPTNRILIETDCPFLPPQSNRGKRNEPSFITETVQTIADIKELTFEEVSNTTYQNTTSLFKLA